MADLKQRIFDLARDLQLMNVATITEDGKPRVRYVGGKAGTDLTLHFSTYLDSAKVSQIARNPNVHVTLGADNILSRTWLQVDGVARVSTAASEREAFWFEGLGAYFTGPDDPRYCIVIIEPRRIELWSASSMTPEVWHPEPRSLQ
jgi:general stress protein 26